jgi:hypothetical protein
MSGIPGAGDRDLLVRVLRELPVLGRSFANRIQATVSCNSAIPATVPGDPNTIWNATTNPEGVSCDARRQLVNQLGVGPTTGFAPSPLDNVGCKYGLAALASGAIIPAQFADLNANIGGFDYLGSASAQRTQASLTALDAVYADDLSNSGAQGLKVTPIIDQRDDLDAIPGLNIHTTEWSFVTRARMQKAGDAANQVIIENAEDPTEVENVDAYELAAWNSGWTTLAATARCDRWRRRSHGISPRGWRTDASWIPPRPRPQFSPVD